MGGNHNIPNKKRENINQIAANHLETKNNKDIKNHFANIKSKYILKKIMINLQENKRLKIIKYNKNIQTRLGISINDYKACSDNFSSIIIEIIPVKNKYDKFINIFKDEDISHFHIYFNDCKEETKKTELTKSDKITKIKIIIDYQIKSFFSLFYNCTCIESINFLQFYRKNIINMNWMFFGCSSLEELDLSNFNIHNVIIMNQMFSECVSLKKLNLFNFNNINEKIHMNYMFSKCSVQLKMKIKTQYTNIKEEAFDDIN